MTYAITQTCCNDATCIAVCPVNCIHPTPDEPDFGRTEMLYIDPGSCIDCGACADACPVDAIFPADALAAAGQEEYAAVNAAFYEERAPRPVPEGVPTFHAWGAPSFERSLPADFAPIRVAVVGTGPAGMYAAEDLLLHTNAEVTLVDRLPVAGGLLRYGVAPDHPATRRIGDTFARFHTHPRVRMFLGVDVGTDITAAELAAHHDAVVYAVGAAGDRRLGVPGEELPCSVAATDFVAWYNAHPEVAPEAIDLSETERVVVVGTGNVALDVARILVTDPDTLAATDIADHALAALRASAVREVVLLARRGPEDASCTAPELLALGRLPGVRLVVDDHDPRTGAAIDSAGPRDKAALLRGAVRERVDWSGRPGAGGAERRIVFRFHSAPEEIEAGAVRVTGEGGPVTVPAAMVLRAVGYRGRPVAGLPFDEAAGAVPHAGGRVEGRPGAYVVGWIKRGPSGGIGANRTCAAETVGTLLADAVAGSLPAPAGGARAFDRLVRGRARHVVDARGLAAIERAERARGEETGRPRVKLGTVPELVAAARARRRLLR
ncbi:FAD-dependent oxidoreductase [Streptomyces sp. NPDC101160]|uniref:FAD-dependent oxidoreductase n=1 Tax=Streptomyces sp. NPDC101160 TaxID=3366118 RepID=UPI003820BCCD